MNATSKFGPRPMDSIGRSLPGHIETKVKNFNPQEVAAEILEAVPPRMRSIVTKRFGLDGNEKMTLEQIGKRKDITRERVRQIEAEALELIRENANEQICTSSSCLMDVFGHHGNVMAEEHIFHILLDANEQPDRQALSFLLTILPNTSKKAQSKDYHALWTTDHESMQLSKQIIQDTIQALKKKNSPLSEEELLDVLKSVPSASGEMTNENLHAYLLTSKNITKNPYGEWGLSKWADIIPRGVKDKAYLVTKKNGEPLHFTDIAERINMTKFDHKTAYPQTVHNELIKDERFVLVGRGIYALKEWGYSPGTVLDVLQEILNENGGVMSREEIMKEMMSRRKVRRNTVILNLQNSDFFEKIDSKHYKIKK